MSHPLSEETVISVPPPVLNLAPPAALAVARSSGKPSVNTTAWLAILAVVMTVLKLCCALQTIGTNDVLAFREFAVWLQSMDLCSVYHRSPLFNHLPLVASYLRFLGSLQGETIGQFAFHLRLPGIIADLVLALFLLSQRRREPLASCPSWALALFIASPVSFLVSGFHGNFDSVVVLLMVLAAWMCVRERPVASAFFLALSLQVKVPAMILLPVFWIFWYRQGTLWRFSSTLALVCVVGWIEPLTHDPFIFLHNVFGYSSYWGTWGVTYWLAHSGSVALQMKMTAHSQISLAEQVITQTLKILIVLGITFFAWTRRPFAKDKLFPVLALSWSLFFFLTPGAGVQYMVWLAPFVLLYHPRWYLGMTGCCSLFCCFFYRIICNDWLLDFGNSTVQNSWVWGPWMLWAWVGTSFGLYLLWLEMRRTGETASGPRRIGALNSF